MKVLVFRYCFLLLESLVQDSLGFPPFDLVFGHTVRGPLQFLKKKFLSGDVKDGPRHCLQYVIDFRTMLTKACELAKANLQSTQKVMKENYDVKAVPRSFEAGQIL